MKLKSAILLILTLSCFCVKATTPELQAKLDSINRIDVADSASYMQMVDNVDALASDQGDIDARMQCLLDKVIYLTYYYDKADALPLIQQMQQMLEHDGAQPKPLYDAWTHVVNGYVADSRTIFAMEQLQHMLDYANDRKDYYGLANVYTLYGNLYINNYDEALKNLDLAREYMEMSGNPQLTPGIYYLMAKSALNADRADDVLRHTSQMLEAEGGQNYKHLAAYLDMMAHLQLGDTEKAAADYAIVQPYCDNPAQLGIHEHDVVTSMLKYLVQTGQTDKAMAYIGTLDDDAYAIVKKEVEAAHYLTTGNLKSATEALRQLADLREQEVAAEQRARIESVNAYMIQRKLQEQLHQEELDKAHRTTVICFIAIAALLCIIGVGIYLYVKLRRANRQLTADRQRLEAERQDALHLGKLKSTFIDNMSHELRTPLNSIMGFTEILNNPDFKPTEEKRNSMLQHIHTQSELLIHLLDNVVTLSRIDAGDVVPNIERIHLSEIVEEVCEPLYKEVAKGVAFNVERGMLSGIEIFTDRDMITIVTKAVLQNAVKFTQHGGIDLDCSVDGNGNLIMTVTDTGDGIPADMADRIYDRYEKLGRIEQGFGLGLSCSRELLDMMGGSITLDTSYTRGAKFIITIKNEKPT